MTYIIAEIGVNHNGCIDTAKQLIYKSKLSGADAAKFQLFDPEELCSEGDHKTLLHKLTLPREAYLELEKECKLTGYSMGRGQQRCDREVDFLCTAFDAGNLEFLLENTNMKYVKIPSGEITNRRLLEVAGASGKPIILSTGMSNLEEIQVALCHIGGSEWREQSLNVILLHCVSSYPADARDTNLRAMTFMEKYFMLPVGLSDHSIGATVPIAAAALGARVIEKHFTDNIYAKGPDHKASMTPMEFRNMVYAIHEVNTALGDGNKRCMPSEETTKQAARRNPITGKRP